MTTLTELNGKVWYRFLKVIFILCYLPYIILLLIVIDEQKIHHDPIFPNSIRETLKDPEFYKLNDYDMREVISSVDRNSNEPSWFSTTTNERVFYEDIPFKYQNEYIRTIKIEPVPTTPLPNKYIYKSYYTYDTKKCVMSGIFFTIFYILVMECIRRGFYYIMIGKLFPRE